MDDFQEAEVNHVDDAFAIEDAMDEILVPKNTAETGVNDEKTDLSFSNTPTSNTSTSRGGRTLA